MLNGRLVREYAICADCGEECKVVGKHAGDGWFYCNGEKLCRQCAKKKKII